MNSGGISLGGLASGLDTNSIIDKLVSLENNRVLMAESRKDKISVQLDSYSKFKSRLGDFQDVAAELRDADSFNIYSSSSSDEDILTLEGTTDAQVGSYDIKVYQKGSSEKIASNVYGSKTTALGLSGTFEVNKEEDADVSGPVQIEITADDSLKSIAEKINSAEDIGITASILQISEGNYQMIFSSVDEGADGAQYTETAGTVLQDLGILDSSGGKGNLSQILTSSVSHNSSGAAITADTLFSDIDGGGFAAGDTLTINGKDSSGNDVSDVFVISDPANTKVSDFLAEIENAFHGMVDASVSASGEIQITDVNSGETQTSVSLGSSNGYDFGSMDISQAGYTGILQSGKDTFLNIDGLDVRSSSSTVEDVIEGVKINVKKADVNTTVKTTIGRDTEGLKKLVSKFIDGYNTIIDFIDRETKASTADYGEEKEGNDAALAGDTTVRRLRTQFRDIIGKQLGIDEDWTTLSMIGIESDKTGSFSLDSSRFEEVISEDFDNVVKLFTTGGYSDNTNVTLGRSTDQTQDGVYQIDTDNDTITIDGSTYAGTRSGEILKFNDGPAKGLSVTAASGNGVVEFNFTNGIAGNIDNFIETITDSVDGILKTKTDSINTQIKRYNERIDKLERHVENYRQTLIRQFTAMEESMSTMQSQGQNMLSQIGMGG
ncbi:MAG: flagellar filament capping protein FliD [Fibrobacterota bacterium]